MTRTPTRPDGDAAFAEEFSQAFDGTADSLLRGFVTDAEAFGHFLRGFLFKATEQNGVTVRFAEFTQRGIEVWRDVFPGHV